MQCRFIDLKNGVSEMQDKLNDIVQFIHENKQEKLNHFVEKNYKSALFKDEGKKSSISEGNSFLNENHNIPIITE